MLGTQIKPVTVAKDLGVYTDCPLNFNEHITKTASDCMFKLTRGNRIKHLFNKKTLIYLINAFFFSKLFYCSTVHEDPHTTLLCTPHDAGVVKDARF